MKKLIMFISASLALTGAFADDNSPAAQEAKDFYQRLLPKVTNQDFYNAIRDSANNQTKDTFLKLYNQANPGANKTNFGNIFGSTAGGGKPTTRETDTGGGSETSGAAAGGTGSGGTGTSGAAAGGTGTAGTGSGETGTSGAAAGGTGTAGTAAGGTGTGGSE